MGLLQETQLGSPSCPFAAEIGCKGLPGGCLTFYVFVKDCLEEGVLHFISLSCINVFSLSINDRMTRLPLIK